MTMYCRPSCRKQEKSKDVTQENVEDLSEVVGVLLCNSEKTRCCCHERSYKKQKTPMKEHVPEANSMLLFGHLSPEANFAEFTKLLFVENVIDMPFASVY